MGMGMDEVDIQPRPPQPPQQQPHHHHHQSQPQAAPPQQQGRNPNPHPHPQPHPIQRRDAAAGGGGAGPGGHPSNNHGLSLSLPLHLAAGGSSSGRAAAAPAQAPGNGGGAAATGSAGDRHGHGHGRDDCWSEGATNTLIEAWGDRYLELNRGNLKQKHWKDVADAVSHRGGGGDCGKAPKTDVQCKNRLDTLKKKYKLEKGKIFSGGAASKWPFFHKLDELIGPSRKHQTANGGVHQHLPGATKALPPAAAAPPGPKSAKEIRPPDDAHAHAHLRAVNQNNNNNNNMTMNSGSSKSDETPDTTDSCPNGLDVTVNGKAFKKRKMPAEDGSGGGPLRELTRAILKFGEVYERVERSKQQQLMDLEKQRMEFIKEMELQRMQLFMQTQLELAKLKHAKHGNTGNRSSNPPPPRKP